MMPEESAVRPGRRLNGVSLAGVSGALLCTRSAEHPNRLASANSPGKPLEKTNFGALFPYA